MLSFASQTSRFWQLGGVTQGKMRSLLRFFFFVKSIAERERQVDVLGSPSLRRTPHIGHLRTGQTGSLHPRRNRIPLFFFEATMECFYLFLNPQMQKKPPNNPENIWKRETESLAYVTAANSERCFTSARHFFFVYLFIYFHVRPSVEVLTALSPQTLDPASSIPQSRERNAAEPRQRLPSSP